MTATGACAPGYHSPPDRSREQQSRRPVAEDLPRLDVVARASLLARTRSVRASIAAPSAQGRRRTSARSRATARTSWRSRHAAGCCISPARRPSRRRTAGSPMPIERAGRLQGGPAHSTRCQLCIEAILDESASRGRARSGQDGGRRARIAGAALEHDAAIVREGGGPVGGAVLRVPGKPRSPGAVP